MREGWTYKKLGEVCRITMGQSPESESYNKEGNGMPFFQGCSDFGALYPVVTTYCSSPKRIADPLDVLISVRAPIGTLNLANDKCCIGRGLASIRAIENVTDFKFVYYFLSNAKTDLQNQGIGATFKCIGKDILTNYPVNLPSLNTQRQIVSELDLISHILDQKRQQLKEYDALAESIFYDMFGDPVENPKGWEEKEFGSLCKIFAGGDKPVDISEIQNDIYQYPVIANGDGVKGILGYSKNYRIAEESVTIGSRGASIGNCRIVNGRFTPVVRLIALVPNSEITCQYLYFASVKTKFRISGAGQAQLTIPNVKAEKLLLPPLPLQREFAAKIESIEQQKQLLKESIKETEMLFQSRMDYWFSER